jgi:hypothetical protein
VVKRLKLAAAVAQQVLSNRSGVGHEQDFAAHRERLTQEILQRAPPDGNGRLCLLGAGNGSDVDLERLAARFAEVHLVDNEPEAVRRATARVSPTARARLTVHAPLDASGIFDSLEGWSRTPPDGTELAQAVRRAVARVLARLPGRFYTVVSCCLLTQLQLVLLQVLGEHNLRFEDLRAALGRIHVRTLAGLLAPGGSALLVTDLTSSDTYPLDDMPPGTDLGALMGKLIHAGNVIHAAHPGLLSAEIRRDDQLKLSHATRFPVGPWLWRNGPKTFLVYALEIWRKE